MADLVAYTHTCSEHDHPEFRLHYNDGLVGEDDLRDLITRLEDSVRRGERYAPGSSFTVGWVVLRVGRHEDGALVLQEPDMIHTPLWWIDSVNHCLIHRRLQRGVCASVLDAAQVAFPSTTERAAVTPCFLDGHGTSMRRFDGGEGHSGWLLTCDDPAHAHDPKRDCTDMPLYEAVVGYDPRVIPYLGLPSGVSVTIGPDGPRIRRDGELLTFKPGSLLDGNFGGARP